MATKKIKLNTIYHSDCVKFMESMDENFVDLTITSPPYDGLRDYKGYHFAFEAIANQLFRVTKKGAKKGEDVAGTLIGGTSTASNHGKRNGSVGGCRCLQHPQCL